MSTQTSLSPNGNGAVTRKASDYASDQEVRWCPGCGDYSILKQVQKVFADLGLDPDQVAIISGIGCSSRFPYYLKTYGMHSIHGRAPAFASGLRMANPDLSLWMITGDGDGLSIGGNHLIHLLRRNFNLNLLLFNNQIYGLTKGQYSPTSEVDKRTKSTPMGSLDHPINPLAIAMGADATFVARSMDRDPKHLQAMLHRSHQHTGASFLEIYQNCNIFNDGAFFAFTDKKTKAATAIFLEHGQPLVFGQDRNKGIRINGLRPEVVDLRDGTFSQDDLWIHDERDMYKAQILARFFDDPTDAGDDYLPRPFGVFYEADRPCYEELLFAQLNEAKEKKGSGDLDALLSGGTTWDIE
ncbi:MAG: 2-oxoacid:ferredoxin oxidoreductase subunit beta [Bacteroidota bacterium]